MDRLLVVIPTRSRPPSIPRLIRAWNATDAWTSADMLLAVDDDDPQLPAYRDVVALAQDLGAPVKLELCGPWPTMVAKLNAAALRHAFTYTAVGFAGDDHVPRTPGWAAHYLWHTAAQPCIVYGDDTRWHGELATEWAMSAALILTLGRMVPADVAHLYCDNAIMDLGRAAGCLLYLPGVTIEHMHYTTGKSHRDSGYERVNSPRQYRRDRRAYEDWRTHHLPAQAERLRGMLAEQPGGR